MIRRLILGLGLGAILVIAITAVFAPWGFMLGGHFHPIPMWQGWGRLHSVTAGDYAIFVRMTPTPRGSRRGGTAVQGVAYLCTPRGDRYSLRLTGGTSQNVWLHMDGVPFELDMANRPTFWRFTNADYTTWRPRLELKGKWQFPDLVMEDHGTLSAEFSTDGSLRAAPARNQVRTRENVPITFKEGSESEFESACAALHPTSHPAPRSGG